MEVYSHPPWGGFVISDLTSFAEQERGRTALAAAKYYDSCSEGWKAFLVAQGL